MQGLEPLEAKLKALSCSFPQSRWAEELPARWEFPCLGATWAVCAGIQPCQGLDPLPWCRWDPQDGAPAFPGLCKRRAAAGAGRGRIRPGGRVPIALRSERVRVPCPVGVGHGRGCCREQGWREPSPSSWGSTCAPQKRAGGTGTGLTPRELQRGEMSPAPGFQIQS